MTDISVVIPVGPSEANKRWLTECLESVAAQTHQPYEVVIIDDQAGIDFHTVRSALGFLPIKLWQTPWLSGVAHAFNFGVALALTDLVVLLGSDDYLEPWALADCAAAWEKHKDPLAYYSLDVRYMDTGETQWIACGAAMVTKALWNLTGGFPTQSAIGSSDAALLSIIIGQKGRAGIIRRIDSPQGAPYLYRRHEGTDTRMNYSRFETAIITVRDRLTRDWQPPTWTEVRI